MGALIGVAIVGGVVAIIAVVVVVSLLAEKKRTEQMHLAAQQLGLPFFPKGDPQLQDRLNRFHLFSLGRGRFIKNMLHGETEDIEMGIFDYQYTTGAGKHSTTWIQTVLYFESSGLQLPKFSLRPESLLHKIEALVGFTDINFESHPEFSKMFHLQGGDEQAVRRLFRPEVLRHLEGLKGICMEGQDRQLVYYRTAKRIKPEDARQLMEEGFKILGLLRQREPGF